MVQKPTTVPTRNRRSRILLVAAMAPKGKITNALKAVKAVKQAARRATKASQPKPLDADTALGGYTTTSLSHLEPYVWAFSTRLFFSEYFGGR